MLFIEVDCPESLVRWPWICSLPPVPSVGLVSRVVPQEELRFESLKIAESICAMSRSVTSLGKAFFYTQVELPQNQAYQVWRSRDGGKCKARRLPKRNQRVHREAQSRMDAFQREGRKVSRFLKKTRFPG
ncbi:hypothetical protein L596_014837 [Steinernema carpocapsae]|uniref:Uncharacterized protein n=1 Tax=Steinernema carpocapsae TaxID=34508 RepID=A0A4U5NDY3_STECR|nr:hypothetical protein L596_014837 [Steinernema carpocapsae]